MQNASTTKITTPPNSSSAARRRRFSTPEKSLVKLGLPGFLSRLFGRRRFKLLLSEPGLRYRHD